MKRELVLVLIAALVGAFGAQAFEQWLRPTEAHAGNLGAWAVQQEDGSFVVSGRNTTLEMTPDGTVRVKAPEQLIIGAAEDVKIEGYRVTIDASSEVKIESSKMLLDLYDYTLEANHIEIGESGSDIKLADGSDPICINDDGNIVKSQRVKAQ